MANQKQTPYDCHIFVCVNDRGGARKSCADGDNVAVRQLIKEAVARRGWLSAGDVINTLNLDSLLKTIKK